MVCICLLESIRVIICKDTDWLNLSLNMYVAGLSEYAQRGESWEKLSHTVERCPEAVNCLCAHYAIIQMIPVNQSSLPESINSRKVLYYTALV